MAMANRFGLSVVLVFALLLVQESSADAIDLPADQLTVVLTELDPFVVNSGGRPDGFYAEIWNVVAADLGVEYEVIWVDTFSELLEAIDRDEADVAVTPLAPTAARHPRSRDLAG